MLPRTRVKICGITNLEDALLAVHLGADALGFIFYHKSPRSVTPGQAREIIEQLPPFVTPVAVMVNESLATVHEMMRVSGCQLAQLHGTEPPELLAQLPWPAIKGISVATMEDLALLAPYRAARAILLDTRVAGQYGGTGKTFDWTVAKQAQQQGWPIILAGGLCPENVADALAAAQPRAIDVSSGVEATPGKKDPERLRRLFEAITAYNASRSHVPATDR